MVDGMTIWSSRTIPEVEMKTAPEVMLENVSPFGGRHPWEEEPNWQAVLPQVGLSALELLVELESGAEAIWREALATLEAELGLDPGLCTDFERCRELGPWAWLRSTPLYRSLERELAEPSAGDDEWACVPEAW
jgi:hypothetical protein